MGCIIVLVGTGCENQYKLCLDLSQALGFGVLKPSTTRGSKISNSDFHEQVDSGHWRRNDFAWSESYGGIFYGMDRTKVVSRDRCHTFVTVCNPAEVSAIRKFREESFEDIIMAELRIDKWPRSSGELGLAADIVFRGTYEVVWTALTALARLCESKGGVLDGATIKSFLAAGALLESSDMAGCSVASYDLNLGDEIWCQGKYIKLDDRNPFFNIPRYSYALVQSKEVAALPTFVAGRFDLKVSLFFEGVILSNGPQVDPGYTGSLFCMLYNGSDSPVGIKRGQHFATLEFRTTVKATSGYQSKYQGKVNLADFIPGHAAGASGGAIIERIEEKANNLREEWTKFNRNFYAVTGILITMALAVIAWEYVVTSNLRDEYEKKLEAAELKFKQLNNNMNERIIKLNEQAKKSENNKERP